MPKEQPMMDAAAAKAKQDLIDNYSEEERAAMIRWMADHYNGAGYRRLGKVLLGMRKDDA